MPANNNRVLTNISKIISTILILISIFLLYCAHGRTIIHRYNTDFGMIACEDNPDKIILKQSTTPNSEAKELSLHAKSACLMEAASKRILYNKNADTPLPNASTTKIMTCLLALELGNPDDYVTVSKYAQSMPDVQLNINENEQYRLNDLLYSLMLESHNDTAVAIAEHIAGSVEEFAVLMNEKAAKIGCTDTCFVTPNGLDKDNHHTTAGDLCLIAAYAVDNKEFLDIIQTKSYSFTDKTGKRKFTVNNKDAFLSTYKGSLGIKTGFTGKAGYCFVGAARRNDMTLVSSVLASGWPPDKSFKWSDTASLMNYGFDNYHLETFPSKTIALNPIPFESGQQLCYSEKKAIQVTYKESITYPVCQSDRVSLDISLPKTINVPIERKAKLGTISFIVNNETISEKTITSEVSVAKYNYHDIIKFVLKYFLI